MTHREHMHAQAWPYDSATYDRQYTQDNSMHACSSSRHSSSKKKDYNSETLRVPPCTDDTQNIMSARRARNPRALRRTPCFDMGVDQRNTLIQNISKMNNPSRMEEQMMAVDVRCDNHVRMRVMSRSNSTITMDDDGADGDDECTESD